MHRTRPATGIYDDLTFTYFTRNGHRWWRASNGRTGPVIRGGADDGGDDGTDTDSDDTTDDDTDDTDSEDDDDSGKDGDAAKWKRLSRKNEADKKRLARELDDLKKKSMTDSEKAIEAAKAEGRREGAMQVAAARIEAALTGIVPDPEAIVEDIDLSRYLTDDGTVDVGKVKALKKKYQDLQPVVNGKGGGHPSTGQGHRGGTKLSGAEAGKAEAARRFAKADTSK